MRLLINFVFIAILTSPYLVFSQNVKIKKIEIKKWESAPKNPTHQVTFNIFILKPSSWEYDLVIPRLKRIAEAFSQAGVIIQAQIYKVKTKSKYTQIPFLHAENSIEQTKGIQIRNELIHFLDTNYSLGNSINLIYLQKNKFFSDEYWNTFEGFEEWEKGVAYAEWNSSYPLNTIAWIPYEPYGRLGFNPAFRVRNRDDLPATEKYLVDTHEICHILFQTGHNISSKGGYIMSAFNNSSHFSKSNLDDLFRSELLREIDTNTRGSYSLEIQFHR